MLYINFILNEKNEVECIGYSIQPTTNFGLKISNYKNDEADVDLIISNECSDEERAIIFNCIDKMKDKCSEILEHIDVDQIIKQINRTI